MTQMDIPTLEDIDSAFAALVLPDFSDFSDEFDLSDELDQFDELDQLNQFDVRELSRSGADLSGYLAIHQAMRVANEQLVRGIGTARVADPKRAAALGRWFRGYSDELRTHHHIEDAIIFPELAERVPAYADYADALTGDHHHLDRVIDALHDALVDWAQHASESEDARNARYTALDLAVELRDFLEEHLAIEDADVLPMIERHFTADEYVALEKQAGKAITIRQAMFTAPWYMATVDAETAARTLREAPRALRIVYALSRRGYARLVANAFGGRP